MGLYHVYSCYELGVETIATRRVPCHYKWYFVKLEQMSEKKENHHKYMKMLIYMGNILEIILGF